MGPPAVAVVDAQTPGNVGTIARAMKNFGFRDLKLVDPPVLDPDGEAYGFAGRARRDVLPNADVVALEDLVGEYHTVGFTAITNEDSRRHVRFPVATPAELAEELATVETDVVFVFGREDNGLTNDELAKLDRVCTIPASDRYPSLNLGQAATVALYELRELALEDSQLPEVERERADEVAIERLYGRWDDLLDAVDHPEEKRDKTMRMLRRIFGRADPTEREVVTLLGVLRRAAEHANGEIDGEGAAIDGDEEGTESDGRRNR